MKTFSLKRNKKGVSPIIATLLLIVIAVAAAVVTYAFVTGFIGTATSQSNQQGELSIDSGAVNNATAVTVYVRNTGTKAEILSAAYVDNVLYTSTTYFGNSTGGLGAAVNLPVGGVQTVTIGGLTAINDGTSHTVRIVASDGTPVAYSVHS